MAKEPETDQFGCTANFHSGHLVSSTWFGVAAWVVVGDGEGPAVVA
jgi:hypothetical protein